MRDAIGVDLVYAGIAGRSASIFAADGLDIKRWRDLMKTGGGTEARSLLREAAGLGDPKLLVDATADEGMGALYGEALAAGFHVVSCNKKPFAGTLQSWNAIRAAAREESLARSWKEAAARGRRWRYVARVDGDCGAQLREVPADSPLGRLAGPENIFAFTTARYPDQPLVVSGPGAGPMVTAAGAFGDILRVARAAGMAAAKGGA